MTSNQLREKLLGKLGEEDVNMPEYYEVRDNLISSLIDILLAQRAALEHVKAKKGLCIFGTMDLASTPTQAFRQGSSYSFGELAEHAEQALADTDERLKKMGVEI